MSENIKKETEVFKSESSIFVHPIQKPQANQTMLPTWSLEVTSIIAFVLIIGSIVYFSKSHKQGK